MPELLSCPLCATEVERGSRACPRCNTPLPDGDAPTQLAPGADDVTRLAGTGTPAATGSSGGRVSSSSSGWLSSSGAIDHGRFDPGTLLGGRYRIVGRLGRGGMGEVYRADDLKLGQPVALKFLPAEVDRDPARLTQLHTEVRMARQVSHPNVCRVYDIDEVDGHTFLSMEYVDGEDLASLLRRIGRFPEDRGLEIARQICAGLAAAHERGVVHRDFKPANVMVDGTGRVRITDFGLAGVSGEAIRAGTPAYMAPEQLAGGEVTSRSDIYALGLVLYEVFTGQRALEGRNLAELIRKREQAGIVPPSAIVHDLHADVETAILRCLRPDPDQRPASALAVSAMLPGGDPLAAALAAGQTPSPEMVAAAGEREALSSRASVAAVLWLAASLVVIVGLYQRVMLINRVATPKPPAALVDRAQEAVARFGYGDSPVDSSSGLGFSLDYVRYIAETSSAPDRWASLNTSRPESFYLWHRTSPRLLVPLGAENPISGQNPPLNIAGMTLTVVDAQGRLSEFHAVPDPRDAGETQATADWSAAFALAGLSLDTFKPVAPGWVPVVFADVRLAWEGPLPERPEHTLRVEAASFRGRPVFFSVSGPWSRSARTPSPQGPTFNRVMVVLSSMVMLGLMVAGAVLARRNIRFGRGDRRGALSAASIIFVASFASWVLAGTHIAAVDQEVSRLFGAVGRALFDAAVLWLTYLGLEPYVRRHSPERLIGWSRLLAGHWRDPRVGVDVLTGISAGLAMTLLFAIHNVVPPLLGRAEPMPISRDVSTLMGVRYVLGSIASQISNAVSSAMLGTVGIVALVLMLRRRWLGVAVAIVLFTPVALSGMFPPGTPVLDLLLGGGIIAIFVGTIVRFGLLAAMAALFTHFVLLRAPITADFSSWRAPFGFWYVGVVAGIALLACYLARTRGPGPSRAPRYLPEGIV